MPDALTTTIPITKDTLLLSRRGAGDTASCGQLRELQVQSTAAYALFGFDLTPLRGRVATSAKLRLHRVKYHLVRVGISTVATEEPWLEGEHAEPHEEAGAACFRYAAYAPSPSAARWWTRPGGNILHAAFGHGGSRWKTVTPAYDPRTDWFEISFPADWINAMIAGVQTPALLVADDFQRFESWATVHSRESQFPPELVVESQPAEPSQPEPPAQVVSERDELGREWVSFEAPHANGFEIVLSAAKTADEGAPARAARLPMYALPAPGAAPRRALISFERSSQHQWVGVRAINASGARSEPCWAELPPRPTQLAPIPFIGLDRVALPTEIDAPFTMDSGPSLSEDGRWIRSAGQTWWNPTKGPITLQAARKEFAAFQVVLCGGPGSYRVTLADWQSPAAREPEIQTNYFREHYVRSRLGVEKYCPDALVPIAAGETLKLDLEPAGTPTSAPASKPTASSQATTQPQRRRVTQTIWLELFVPDGAARGVWRNRLIVVRDGLALLDIPLEFEVVDLTLPDRLSYPITLRTRNLPLHPATQPDLSDEAWQAFEAYHRAAHEHRLTFAPIPYHAGGQVFSGFAPRLVSAEPGSMALEWTDWDRRFGRLLSGAAFAGLPRDRTPLAELIVPVHECWPAPYDFARAEPRDLFARKYHFRTSRTEYERSVRPNPHPNQYMKWPFEDAFAPQYRAKLHHAWAAFQEHFREAGWNHTRLQLSFANRPGAPQTSWWQLNPPEVIDDVLGLGLLLESCGAAARPAEAARLADLGTPFVARDRIAGRFEVAVLGDSFRDEQELVLGRPDLFPKVWTYIREDDPEYGWSSPLATAWADRVSGAHGSIVAECVGEAKAWDVASNRSYLYAPAGAAGVVPTPSLRLKSLRRIQEDMEWVAMYLPIAERAGADEGMVLDVLGRFLAARGQSRVSNYATLLPVVVFPGRLDTVAFEEVRRSLRAAVRTSADSK